MPNVKISAAADAGVLDGTEKIPLARIGSTVALHTDPHAILNIGTITTASAAVGSNANGVNVIVGTGTGDGAGDAGYVFLYGNAGGVTGAGGRIKLAAGPGGATSGDGGVVELTAGSAANGPGGNISLTTGAGGTAAQQGQLQVNGDAAIMLATFSWAAAEVINGRTIFTATRPMRVTALIGRVDVANGGAATFTLSKAASGTAFSAGTLLHTGSFNLAGTVNTNQTLALTGTAANLLLAAGDSVGIVETGALALATGAITVHLTPQ